MRTTEITVQVFADLPTIFAQLKSLGFAPVQQYVLHDWYFTHLPLSADVEYPELMKNSLLVRQVTADGEKVQLVYKDKTMDAQGNVVSEAKIKVDLSDLDATLKVFAKAGLTRWCELKQDVSVFRQGTTEFAVQAVDGVGIFIEYEANDTMAGLTAPAKMESMFAELQKLGLPLGTDLSCKKVYLKYLAGNN